MPITPLYVQETHTPFAVTWLQDSGAALNLTGATLSVRFAGVTGSASFAGAGTFAITNAAGGLFTYALAASDVANPGTWQLQFTALFADGSRQMTDPITLSVLPVL